MISVRDETAKDHDEIRRLTIDAFANSEFGHDGEAELIDSLRAASHDQLSLVAYSDDELIGHILFTPVVIRTPEHKWQGMGLGPMSVAPEHQKKGIGSLLVKSGLRRLFDNGCPFVVVLGHPGYYPRFGFLPASQFGISHGFKGIPQDIFFIQLNEQATLNELKGGAAYYEPQFGTQHKGK